MKNNVTSPFRTLELQLQLEKLEEEWETAKELYNKDTANVETVDEILKITLEKIKVLAEINMKVYEA
jgi:hypothetical protein